jgi:ribose 5-phosphate isomerase B
MKELPENTIKNLFIGCDHTSLSQKFNIIDMLKKNYTHINIIDMGCHNSKSCNYTDIAHDTCQQFLLTKDARIILLCGTGTGMSIVANRYKGVRCAYGHSISQIMTARQHNDVNALALGVQLLELSDMRAMVQAFLETEFSKKDDYSYLTRHSIRVAKIDNDIKYLDNKIENEVVERSHTKMPFKSNAVRDVVHTDILKPENKKRVRKLPTHKNDNLHPINLKVNMVPFEKRHLSMNSNSDNENSLYFKKLPSQLKDSDSLKVNYEDSDSLNLNYEDDDMYVKHNDEDNQVFTKTINPNDTTETLNNQRSDPSVITNFIKDTNQNRVKTTTTYKKTTYTPSKGEPLRTFVHYDYEKKVHTNYDSDTSDKNELTKNNVVKHSPNENKDETLNTPNRNIVDTVSEDRSKMVLQMEKNHMLDKLKELKKQETENKSKTIEDGYNTYVDEIFTTDTENENDNLDNYDADIDVDQNVIQDETKTPSKNNSTHLTYADGKRVFQPNKLNEIVPFSKNKVELQNGSRSFKTNSTPKINSFPSNVTFKTGNRSFKNGNKPFKSNVTPQTVTRTYQSNVTPQTVTKTYQSNVLEGKVTSHPSTYVFESKVTPQTSTHASTQTSTNVLGSKVTPHTSTNVLGSKVTPHTSTNVLGSKVTPQTSTNVLGSKVTPQTSTNVLGSKVTPQTSTNVLGSKVTPQTSTNVLGSKVTPQTSTNVLGSNVTTHTGTYVFGSNVTPQYGTTNLENKSRNLSNNKIESRNRDIVTNTTNKLITMPDHLEYPNTINTDNTLLPVMENYAQNCNEAARLEEDIMRKIVELRERVRLIYRDMNAEMGTVFNLNDNTQQSL